MTQLVEYKTKALQVWFENNPTLASRGIDEAMWNALCTSVYPGAKPDSVLMAVDYCAARNLDIMMKPVHLVPMNVKNAQTGNYEWRDVPMPGIGMYRIQSSRSNNIAGIDEPEFGETITMEFKSKNGKVTVSFPEWCKVTVHKIVGDRVVSYVGKEYWLENYATEGKDSDAPNAMWKKRPRGQIAKCAEAQALRRGWPEIDQGPTAEEMEGKGYEIEINPAQPMAKLEKPKARTSLKDIAKATTAATQADGAPEFEAHVLSVEAQKQADRLVDCQNWNDLNEWAADSSANFPEGHPDFNELVRLYNERGAQLPA